MRIAGDYHQYFIQNGRHIGRYEDMYRNCPDPWRIEELGPRLDMEAALLLIAGRAKNIGRFLDIGAGLGLFSGLACSAIWRENPRAEGLITDISATAVAGAAQRLQDPRLAFQCLDIRAQTPPGSFDLVIMAQVLWGILENLGGTLGRVASLLPAGGLLLVSQHFPGNQGYGADVVASPEDLAAHLRQAGFSLLNTLETDRAVNHHWAALAVKNP